MFDVTMTDAEFKRHFVVQNETWMKNSRPEEPDLEVEGFNQTFLFRLLSALGLG